MTHADLGKVLLPRTKGSVKHLAFRLNAGRQNSAFRLSARGQNVAFRLIVM